LVHIDVVRLAIHFVPLHCKAVKLTLVQQDCGHISEKKFFFGPAKSYAPLRNTQNDARDSALVYDITGQFVSDLFPKHVKQILLKSVLWFVGTNGNNFCERWIMKYTFGVKDESATVSQPYAVMFGRLIESVTSYGKAFAKRGYHPVHPVKAACIGIKWAQWAEKQTFRF
jgi:hypothetical protein